MTTTELTTLVTGLWAKVKSHVTTAINGLATKSELANYCPIIEDERTSTVATIVGTATFAELKDGQRIIICFSQITANNSSIQLNLSSGEVTEAIPAWVSNYSIANGQRPLRRMAKYDFSGSSCAEFVYNESDNRWVCLTQIDTAPQRMYQGLITAGTSTDGFAISPSLLRDNFYLKSEAMAKRTLVTTGSALTATTYVDLGTTDTIAPTLPASPSRADEFVFTFTCVSALPNITLPPGVALADGFDWSEADAGVQFQVSICDNIAAYLVLTPNT